MLSKQVSDLLSIGYNGLFDDHSASIALLMEKAASGDAELPAPSPVLTFILELNIVFGGSLESAERTYPISGGQIDPVEAWSAKSTGKAVNG